MRCERVLLGNKKIGRQERRETSQIHRNKTKFEVGLKRHEKVLDILLIYVKKCLNVHEWSSEKNVQYSI